MDGRKVRSKRKLGSYPFLSVVFSITLALMVIGLFGLMLIHTKKLTTIIQENVELQVYLDKSISQAEINRLQRTISSKPYVLIRNEQPEISFTSREEAAKQFIQDTGEDFKEFIGDNPLRDHFTLKVDTRYQSLDSLNWVSSEIKNLKGVYEVSFVESLVQSINENLTKIGAILVGFAVILVFVVIILINNTIKLALFSQRFLIRSMQLVGATGSFIRKPFLNRAAFYGFMAGIIASGVLFGLLTYANRRIEDLKQLQDQESLLILFGSITFMGVFVAYFSTFRAIRKYLKTSLDDLY